MGEARRIESELPRLERVDRDSFDEPKCFDILLNYACSAKCLFCSQDFEWRKEPNDLSFEKAVEFIYLAYKNGYRRLGFTGGEPTLRRDLPKLIALAKKIGFGYVRIQTNGLRLADPDYARTLAEAGLTFVKYSIHGDSAALHDELVAVPGAFDKCLRSIENLKALRLGIGVNIVLNERNYRRLPEFFELFLLKLKLSNFVIIAPLYEGNMTLHADRGARIGVRMSELAPHVRRAYEVFSRINYPKPPLLLHFTPCVLPGYEQQMLGWSAFNTTVVSPKGVKRDLDETAQAHTVKTDACRRCVYGDRCIGWDASYARVYGTDEIAPLTEVPRRYDADQRGRPRHQDRAGVLTDNEQCVLEVLKIRSGVTTQEFLAVAESLPLCKDCKDENAVINAAETLIEMGAVERRFVKGKYYWALKAEVPA